MSFGDADIKGTVGHLAHQDVHGATCGHGGCDPYNERIHAGEFQKRVSEDVLELGRQGASGVFLDSLSGLHVKLAGRVPDGGFLLGGFIAFSLDGVDVEEFGTFHVLYLSQHPDEIFDVVSVGGSEVADVQPLKDVLLVGQEGFQRVIEAKDGVAALRRQPPDFLEEVGKGKAQAIVAIRSVKMQQIFLHAADRSVDAHVVVVEDDEEVVGRVGSVVESLEGKSSTHGSVTDECHDVAVGVSVFQRGERHAEGCGNGVGGVTAGEGVIFTLLGRGEGTDAVEFAVGVEGIAASGQDFVTVGLVPDVPDKTVVGGVKDIVQRYGDFHRSKTGGEMSRVVGQFLDDVVPQFVTHFGQRVQGELPQIGGGIDMWEIFIVCVHNHKFRSAVSTVVSSPSDRFLDAASGHFNDFHHEA